MAENDDSLCLLFYVVLERPPFDLLVGSPSSCGRLGGCLTLCLAAGAPGWDPHPGTGSPTWGLGSARQEGKCITAWPLIA